MAFIIWNDTYNIGIPEFDAHHKELSNIINDIYEAIGKKNEASNLKWAFKELFKYVDYHFKAEEAFISEFADPEFVRHQKTHMDFRKKLDDMWNEFQMGSLARDMMLMQWLKNWFVGHVQGMDRHYAAYAIKPQLPGSVSVRQLVLNR